MYVIHRCATRGLQIRMFSQAVVSQVFFVCLNAMIELVNDEKGWAVTWWDIHGGTLYAI